MKMKKIAFFSFIASFIFNQTYAQMIPYSAPAERLEYKAKRTKETGVFPKQKNTTWDGRIPGTYNIRFKVKGLKPGETVYLADHHIGGKYLRDTTVVDKKGIATFDGTKILQRGMYLFVLPEKKDYFEFLVDDDQDFTISTDTSYYEHLYYKKMKVEGSEENQRFVEYQLGKSGIVEKIIEIDQQLKADSSDENYAKLNPLRNEYLDNKNKFDSIFIAKNPSSMLARFLNSMIPVRIPETPTLADGSKDSTFAYRYYRAHYWDNVDLNEDALVRMPVNSLKQKLDAFFDKVIVPDADTCIQACNFLLEKTRNSIENEKYVIWYLTNRFESSNIMGLDKAFVYMAISQYCQGRAWWVDSALVKSMCDNAYRRQTSLIGEKGADMQLKNQDSVWINTNSIKGPYTILMFWDPTCGHCKEIMPKVAKLYERNKSKGWKVITLSSGDKKKEWYDYLAKHPEISEFTNLIRGEVMSQKYADALSSYYVISSPTLYILDENKKIVANRIDVDKIEEFIAHLDEVKSSSARQHKK
jgi:thiol-disulfide isomerase/thioredoxin